MESSTVRHNPASSVASSNVRSKPAAAAFASAVLAFTISATAIGVNASEVSTSVAQDDSRQTKYDVTIRNVAGGPLSGFSARIYFDISEALAAGLTETHLRCDERYDPSGTGSCAVAQYSGNIYYADLRFGSYSLPAGASGLSASIAYSYEVKARDTAGNVSAASNRATAQTQAAAPGCTGALTTASAIQNAMKNASAGAVILIASGTYTGDRSSSDDPKAAADGRPAGVFYSGNSGSSSSHIVLKGCDPTSPPVLQGTSDRDGSYGIHLTGDYWEIRDLIVQDAQKGIMFDNANRGLVGNVVVCEVGDEAVHFRDGSSYNVIEYSRIYNTGTYQAKYGEGVYVGSDTSAPYEHTVIDNVIRNVSFDGGITAEHIDVKEGATGTIIEYSTFNGTGISGLNSADSFVDIKGVNTTVRHNTGRRNGNSNVADAFQVRTHGDCCLTGTNNRFHDNSVHLDGIGTAGSTNGYVVFATSQSSGTTSSNDVRTDGNSTNIYNRNVN